jgi:hypothetical protein
MTDKELLEASSKAAGIAYVGYDPEAGMQVMYEKKQRTCGNEYWYWNPLTDDGDALRLAVKLNLLILPYPADNAVRVVNFESNENTIVSWGLPPDPYAATRRAITRAAASIGEKMP